jgi:hypothetical protein
MGLFDDLGATVSSVKGNITNSFPSITAVTGSLASGLSSITDKVGGVLSTVNQVFKQTANIKLPLANPLFEYASYTYVISIGILTDEFLNNPDTTYRAGKRFPLLLKSANADPANRANTPYGKFDFFIDNVKIDSIIGFEAGNNTNTSGPITFTITEPYSMGMLFLSIQQLAKESKHPNWNDAPFILVIEFRGNTETGQILNIPKTARYIPFKFTNIDMTVNERGSVYNCSGLPYNQEALSNKNSKFKSDQAIKGTTVQEMLQTGEKSLQFVLNQKLKDIAELNGIEKPDEILILFPKDISSAPKATSGSTSESTSSATTNPKDSIDSTVVFSKLGVTRNTKSGSLEQAVAECNAIGKAKMGFNDSRKGSTPIGKDNAVYNKDTKIMQRDQNHINQNESDFKFRQDTDIPNAINQVVIASEYINATFDSTNLTPEGYRGWWSVDVQSYTNGDVNKTTGQKPRLLVYRIVPYNVHASSGPSAPNIKPPGYTQLKLQAVKEYNYIYTGKNVDVLKFDINYKSNFFNQMSPDGLIGTQDAKTAKSDGGETDGKPTREVTPLGKGSAPDATLGVASQIVGFVKTLAGTDKLGGGGSETQVTRAARLFHDSLTRGTDMVDLNMQILGDPYFIAQSGAGNYTAQPTQFHNLNDDGSVSYQNGEVDILINFRTPIDINQGTGLYNFGPNTDTAPVMQFSGLYKLTNVTSTFSSGHFKQTLVGYRRPMQESTKPEVKDTFSVSKTVPDPTHSDGVQRFDDGSSIQTFDDGSTIVTDSDGNITSTEATG